MKPDIMFDAKKLTEDQVSTIKQWAADGAQLPDIQKKMEDEMETRLTYMDTRFLVLDLGIEIISPKEAEPEEPAAKEELTEEDLEILPPEGTPGADGAVTVTVDEIARPGVMVSGRVTFPDGEGGMWYVDEMGRLGIDPDTAGYRPSEPDVIAFQKKLQSVMDQQ